MDVLALARVHVGDQRPTHARIPEFSDVVDDSIKRFVLVGHGLEEIANAIDHVNKIFGIHTVSYPLKKSC